MKLLLIKSGVDLLVGEYRGLLSGGIPANAPLENPMTHQSVTLMQASAVDPRKHQQVAGFRLVPLPCREIVIGRVDYIGEIKKTDPTYVTYYKILEEVKKKDESPLMVAQ